MRTLPQAKTLSEKDQDILRECKGIIQKFVPDATVLLYGSVARGTQEPDSDYDILVLTERSLSTAEEDQVRDAIYDLELERGVIVCALFYSRDQWNDPLHRVMPLHRSVDREGIVL
ncbi:MAG: nucleotidyltransferase domain-containing protein [Planctomycetes bacterium]|nr:nucleotidyltransferase domain-containing protein [Planctomycetota bacterium]MBM4085615.1 nucleotidyltransferase domain-containing protein [Planctomycetota bacterium]